MALFNNAEEKLRKQSLKALEDKRVAFAEKLKQLGYTSEKSLYGQVSGGFHGIVRTKGAYLYLTGPTPGEPANFTCARHASVSVALEDVFIKSEGMGGMLGFGKKGGLGFKLLLTFPDGTQGDVEVVAGQNCVFENDRGVDPLFDTKRRRGNSNFVWDFKPLEQSNIAPIKTRWLAILGDQV